MSVLAFCTDRFTAVDKNLMDLIADDFDGIIRPDIPPQMIVSLPRARRQKIISIRRQLAQNTYDIDERLDAVLERILTDVTS